jgi:DNA-binding XRE family transcriptional regulator
MADWTTDLETWRLISSGGLLMTEKHILLNELFILNNNDAAKIELVRGRFSDYLKVHGDDKQIQDALQIIEIWTSEAQDNDFVTSCDLADPIFRSLLKNEDSWDFYDIRILASILDYIGTYERSHELAVKLLGKLEGYSREERHLNIKLAIYANITLRLLRGKYFESDNLAPPEQLEVWFDKYMDEGLKLCDLINAQFQKAVFHIRKGLFHQDDDLISRGFYRLKELGEDEVFRMLKADAEEYDFFEGIKMSKNQADKIIGGNIRRIRNEAGMTMKELAEKIGVTVPYISCIENGIRVPKGFGGHEINQVAVVLGVSYDDIFAGINERI